MATTTKDPKFLYRYIPMKRLAEIIMTQSIPIPFPDNWNDQHDLNNALRLISPKKTIGIACFTEEWESSFHWELFAKDGVRLAFYKKALNKRVTGCGAKIGKVEYKSTKEYIKKITQKEDLLFIKRIQYQHEQEWRIVCEAPKGQLNGGVVDYIPFEWEDLARITISPYYNKSEFYQHKAAILNMLNAAGADSVEVLRSTLFESQKVKDAELDYEEV